MSESKKVIRKKIVKALPMFTGMLVTSERYTQDDVTTENGLINTGKDIGVGIIKALQTVVYAGPSVRDVAVGDEVIVNIDKFKIKKFSAGQIVDNIEPMNKDYDLYIPLFEIDGKEYWEIDASQVKYKVDTEEYEVEIPVVKPQEIKKPEESSLILPRPNEERKLIIPAIKFGNPNKKAIY